MPESVKRGPVLVVPLMDWTKLIEITVSDRQEYRRQEDHFARGTGKSGRRNCQNEGKPVSAVVQHALQLARQRVPETGVFRRTGILEEEDS